MFNHPLVRISQQQSPILHHIIQQFLDQFKLWKNILDAHFVPRGP
jgi:hypothetical protein